MRRALLLVPAAVLLAVTACSSSGGHESSSDGPAKSASPAAASDSPVALTAAGVVARLKAAGLPVSNVQTQDERTDPNSMLGRPNGYTGRASFDVPGGDTAGDKYDISRGGVVEVWPDAAGAKKRAAYVKQATASMPALTEYDYVHGPVLLRITGGVVPSTARKFKAALSSM